MPRIDYGDGLVINAPEGMTVLEASIQHGIHHIHACGGQCKCTTCRAEILEGLENCPAMSQSEREALTLAGFNHQTVRLACQLRPKGDIKVRLLLRDHAPLRPEGMAREREVAVLFADLRGFTAFAERHMPFDVLHLLNRYFDRMGTIVDTHNGYVITFLGDGIICLFEAGEARWRVQSATRCGLQMLDASEIFAQYTRDHFGFDLRMGVGIAWGRAVIGQVGYYNKSGLNIVGDVVNTAARVQEATKEVGVRLLVTEGVQQLTKGMFQIGKEFTLALKGKEGQQRLYEILAEQQPSKQK